MALDRYTSAIAAVMRSLGRIVLLFAFAAFGLWFVTTQPFVRPHRSQPPSPDVARMQEHVRHLSETLYPRSFDRPATLAASAAYIHEALAASGAAVRRQAVSVDGTRFDNIVARFGPADGRLLVIGAHYDSYGNAFAAEQARQAFNRQTHTPGADDNASGVAGLIELAHLLAAHPPARTVELVAYTLEEPPHFRTDDMGSAWHARSLTDAKQPIELMISLEMIGFFSDEPNSQQYPVRGMEWLYPTQGNFIAIVSRLQDWSPTRRLKAAMRGAADLPVHSINTLPAIPGVDFSDHLNYWQFDIPALMVTDTSFYRNTEYHRGGDTFERLDYARMGQVVQGVFAFIQAGATEKGH